MRKTLNDYVRQQAVTLGDSVAYETPLRNWSYRELDEASNRVAQGLKSLGVVAGQRVAALTKHTADALVLTLGACKVGAVCMPVNWRLAGPELEYILDNGQARFLMVDREFLPTLAEVPAAAQMLRTVTEGPEAGLAGFGEWFGGYANLDTGFEPDPDQTALQLYSSGTTGLPKGVELSHHNLVANVTAFQDEYAYATGGAGGGPGIQLNPLPSFHIAGVAVAMITLIYGGVCLMRDAFIPAQVLADIEQRQVTHAFLVPAMIQALTMQPNAGTTRFDSLHTMAYGASPISDRVLLDAMQLMKCRFVQVYGLTETAGAITCLPPEDHQPGTDRAYLLRSAGKPGRNVKIRIVDPAANRDCDENQVGEILIHSPQNMIGYWGNPKATAAAFPEGRAKGDDGWFRTGDAGYMRDGYLFIHDRIKDMIISGGENIYPAEVENVLMQHPAVADGAVIGVPDEKWGEAVKACVVLRAGSEATSAEIIAFLRERIAHYKCPKTVDFMPALPRNPSGKLLKFVLRKPYWEGRDRAVA